jgi:hypothetical protein
MSDTINTFKTKDRSRVDANNKFDVEYLHQQYPWYTYQQIKDVINHAGPYYTHVEKELRLKHVTASN